MDKSIHNNSYKAVMNLLRNKRIERSITQEKMAELLGVTRQTYNDYEINVLLCAFTQHEYNEALKQF